MQAVVLAGGQGVRLRPLTLTRPKPLVPVVNRPVIEHIVRWLEQSGVVEVILATEYRADAFEPWLQSWHGIPVRAVQEPAPLGTAGGVANIRSLLHGTTAVINGDNLTDLDLRGMARVHRAMGAVATIAVAAVDDPTGRGVVVMDGDGRVSRFQEKPARAMALARTVNTGTYLIEPAALGTIVPGERAMWETDLFPALIDAGEPVFGFERPHRWLDVGTPDGYFAAQAAIFGGYAWRPPGMGADGIWTEGEVQIDSEATVRRPICIGSGSVVAGATLHGPISVGTRCRIGTHARIERSAIWNDCVVEAGATITNSIIGYNCHIGPGAKVEGALLGDGVSVGRGVRIEPGSRIDPGAVVAHVRSSATL